MKATKLVFAVIGVSLAASVPVMAQDFIPGMTTVTVPDDWAIEESFTGFYKASTGNDGIRYSFSVDDLEGDTAEQYLDWYTSLMLSGTIENSVRYNATINNMPIVILEHDDTENNLPVHCLQGMAVNGQESLHMTVTVDNGMEKDEYEQQYLDILASIRVAGQEAPDTKLNAVELFGTGSSMDVSYTMLHGDMVDCNPYGGGDGKTLVVKAKISPSFSNGATVDQNYYNIEDLVKNQGATTAKYSAISYWAVADMTDGSEGKVISFDVSGELMDLIENGKIPANQMGDYVEGLWILPSLLQ